MYASAGSGHGMVEILYEGCLFISYTVSYGVTHNGCFVMFHSQHTRCTGNESPGHFVCRSQLKRYASLFSPFLLLVLLSLSMPSAIGDEYKI
jgi:hypothetical protein